MGNYQIAVPQHLKANRPKFIINISSWVLKLQKWKINGAIPEEKRVVLVIGPHTSNWDFIIGVLVILSLDAKINWLGKHTIFKRGFKSLLTRLGGIPVNRQDPSDLFSRIKVITEKSNGYLIGMAPEGTRKKVFKLKYGYFRIAKQTKSKIMLAGIDFKKKIVNLDKFFTPTGDLNNDLLFVQDYFSRYSGKRQQ